MTISALTHNAEFAFLHPTDLEGALGSLDPDPRRYGLFVVFIAVYVLAHGLFALLLRLHNLVRATLKVFAVSIDKSTIFDRTAQTCKTHPSRRWLEFRDFPNGIEVNLRQH